MSRIMEIFKAGTWPALEGPLISFSEDDLRAMAIAYNPGLRRASLTIGHPPDDRPVHGWVRQLVSTGTSLFAEIEDLTSEVVRLVRGGFYKKCSASLMAPRHPSNPVPSTYYLRHVGLLGAAAPAVKGMRPVEFAAGKGSNVIAFAAPGLREVAFAEDRQASFAVPPGYSVDAERILLHQRALEYAAALDLDYIDAVAVADGRLRAL